MGRGENIAEGGGVNRGEIITHTFVCPGLPRTAMVAIFLLKTHMSVDESEGDFRGARDASFKKLMIAPAKGREEGQRDGKSSQAQGNQARLETRQHSQHGVQTALHPSKCRKQAPPPFPSPRLGPTKTHRCRGDGRLAGARGGRGCHPS